MDDSALFCLTRRPPPSPTLDVPGRALACRALLAFNYQSAGIVPDCTRSDIRVLPQCLPPLFCADTLDNDSICLTDASRRGKKNVSDSNSPFYGRNNTVYLNSSVFYFSLKRNSHFLSRYSQHTRGSHLMVTCLS